MYRLFMFCLVTSISFMAAAQVLPKEGSALNYRLVGFSAAVPEAGDYKLEVAVGNYSSVDSFTGKIVFTLHSKTSRVVAEVPSFGTQYTWRLTDNAKAGSSKSAPLHHFSTRASARVDAHLMRLNILTPAAEAYKDDFVAVDAGAIMYDMKGQPVWFLPESRDAGAYVQDLKQTPQATLSLLYSMPVEVDFNGKLLWKGPMYIVDGKDSVFARYHSQATRLASGHYMAMGTQVMTSREMTGGDSSWVVFSSERKPHDGYEIGRYGTIVEYDEQGNVVWKWKSSEYLAGSDFGYFHPADHHQRFDPRDNSFYFDEKNNVVYVSFRNLNRIVKVNYPSGKVLAVYGDYLKPGTAPSAKNMFCSPASVGISQEGYIYYMNNNSCRNTDSLPSVVMLKEPLTGAGPLKKVWEYNCTMEGSYPLRFDNGGSVQELQDKSLFVTMGGTYGKMFIVNKEKEILWSALPEVYMPRDAKWGTRKQDKASLMSRTEIERLVWKAEADL